MLIFGKLKLEKMLEKERANLEKKYMSILHMEKELKALGNEIKKRKQLKRKRVLDSSDSEEEVPTKKRKLGPSVLIDLTISDEYDVST